MKKPLRLITVVLAFFCLSTGAVHGQPSGIYVLDNNQGTYRDANIRNYAFVDGFVWRTSWSDIETSKGVYNYAGLDHIIQKLDAINKKLTILFGAYAVEPAYITQQANVSTYSFTDPTTNITTVRAVPYDPFLIARFRIFLAALSNHLVYSKASGTIVPLKDHPVLANLATNIPGLGAIRNVNSPTTSIQTSLPGYTRTKFVDSILTCMKIQTDDFPKKNIFIPFYKSISDNSTTPDLATFIRAQLLASFDNAHNPKISFWQENLAAFKDTVTKTVTGLPTTTFASPLYQLNGAAYTMFQMLQGWTTPFLDPAKTANTTPFDAMCYAYNTYGASYYEVYVSDLDNGSYQTAFSSWQPGSSCGTNPIVTTSATSSNLTVYPNPASTQLSISGLTPSVNFSISVYDMLGRLWIKDQQTLPLNIISLPTGVYLMAVEQHNVKSCINFIKM